MTLVSVCVHFLKLLDTQTQKWTQSLTIIYRILRVNHGMAQTGIWKICMSIIYISSCFNLPSIYQDIINIGYFTSLVNECMYNNILWGVSQMKEKWQGCQIGTHLRGIGLNIKKNSTNQPVKIKS